MRLSRDWSPFDPWRTFSVGDVAKDECGGPDLERVVKVCRDARGNDRLRGCGKSFEGWVLRAGQKAAGSIPSQFRRQVVEDGAVWGLCNDCIDRIESARVTQPEPMAVAGPARRPRRAGEEF